MATSVNMNRKAEEQLRQLIDKKIGAAVREMADIVRKDIDTQYPPASEPGEPPHKRSGGLQKSVFAARDKPLDWVYGTKRVAPHPDGRERANLGLWMELGSRNVLAGPPHNLPRPFLVPVLMRDGMRIIAKHLGGGS